MSEDQPDDSVVQAQLEERKKRLGVSVTAEPEVTASAAPKRGFGRRRFIAGSLGALLGAGAKYLIDHTPGPEPIKNILSGEAQTDPVAMTGFSQEIPLGDVLPVTLPEIRGVKNPLQRPIYWGITPNNFDWEPTIESIQESETILEKGSAIVHFYQDWGENPQGSQFQPEWMDRIRNRGSIPSITWMWGDARFWFQPEAEGFRRFQLKNIVAGHFDDHISTYARAVKTWGEPMFLRMGHEGNGNPKWWPYPWVTGEHPDTGVSINTPEEFIGAWQHVHNIFTSEGVSNVTWVWCPDMAGYMPFDRMYPGDGYVDWVALDGYNWGDRKQWQSFAEIFTQSYNNLIQLAPTKPIMLAETGSREEGGDRAAWFRDTLLVQLPYRFAQVQAVVYFDKEKPDEGVNWRVGRSENSRLVVAEALDSLYYKGNQYQQLKKSPIPVARMAG